MSWHKGKQKWEAHAGLDGKQYHLGTFDNELDAAKASKTWRKQHMPFNEETEHW